jgi:hypothetical protein
MRVDVIASSSMVRSGSGASAERIVKEFRALGALRWNCFRLIQAPPGRTPPAHETQLDQMLPPLTPEQRPEARWMVDPDDYLKPMVYDPKDVRWKKVGEK